MVPFRLFFILLGELEHVRARERLDTVLATSHAIALGFGGREQKAKLRLMTRKLVKLAFPETTQ